MTATNNHWTRGLVLGTILLVGLQTTAGAEEREDKRGPSSGRWHTIEEGEPMDPYIRFKAWTNGWVVKANSARANKAWVRLWTDCMVRTNLYSKEGRLADMEAQRLRNKIYDPDGPDVVFVISDPATSTPLGQTKAPEEDGFLPGVWLRTKLDSKATEVMGYSITVRDDHVSEIKATNFATHPEGAKRWAAHMKAWKAWRESGSPADKEPTAEDGLWGKAYQTRESIRTLSGEDLKGGETLHLEVGLRPEGTEQAEDYREPSNEVVVFKFSLEGSRAAIEWVEAGCQRIRQEVLDKHEADVM